MSNPETADYGPTYRDQLHAAVAEARALGIDLAWGDNKPEPITEARLEQLRAYIWGTLGPMALCAFPGYRGAICQSLGLFLFDRLKQAGYEPELVIGEVNINGTLEYDTMLDDLRREWAERGNGSGRQSMHVWVAVGADVVVDAGIGSRLTRYYRARASWADAVFVGRAGELATEIRSRYIPMLVGQQFVRATNSNAIRGLAPGSRPQA